MKTKILTNILRDLGVNGRKINGVLAKVRNEECFECVIVYKILFRMENMIRSFQVL